MSRIRFGILGGDFRYKLLWELLRKDGYNVISYCNRFLESDSNNLKDFMDNIDVIIGPIPTTRDNKTLAVTDCENIKLEYMFEEMFRKRLGFYIGGVINKDIKQMAENRGIRVFDFFEMEEVAVKNAIPTAEGAIQTAMQESIKTIFDSKALVLGYGRCGKILANMLKGVGARVSVTYRNERDNAYIKAYGYRAIALSEIKSYINEFDFVFNTIPAEILNAEVIKKMSRSTIIIDLAQAPGGTDFNYARDLNIKALYCPGLPGRVAPLSAAEVLKEAVLNISMAHFIS